MHVRFSCRVALIALVLTVLTGTAENGRNAFAAAPLPDATVVVDRLKHLGAAVKLDDRGNAVAVDFLRARPDHFDWSQLAALTTLRSLKCPHQPITDADLRTLSRLTN